jgi:hypothetical protein
MNTRIIRRTVEMVMKGRIAELDVEYANNCKISVRRHRLSTPEVSNIHTLDPMIGIGLLESNSVGAICK